MYNGGIPIPKTLVIWASPSHITLAIWVRVWVRVTGDAHITSVLGIGDAHITETAVVSFPLESGSEGLELIYSWSKSVETEGPLQYLFRVGFALFEGRD